jgi:hypothetical protein
MDSGCPDGRPGRYTEDSTPLLPPPVVVALAAFYFAVLHAAYSSSLSFALLLALLLRNQEFKSVGNVLNFTLETDCYVRRRDAATVRGFIQLNSKCEYSLSYLYDPVSKACFVNTSPYQRRARAGNTILQLQKHEAAVVAWMGCPNQELAQNPGF